MAVLLKFLCVCVRERERQRQRQRQRLREKQSLYGKMLKVISSEFLKSMQSKTQMPIGQPSNLNVWICWIKDHKEKWGFQLTEGYLFGLKTFKFNFLQSSYIYIHAYICIYMHMYMCIYMHIYTHIHAAQRLPVYTSENDVYHFEIWNL